MNQTRASSTGFVQVEGGRLYYETAGAGRALVLLHAGSADSRMWDEQFRVFSHHFQVIRYDARGCGKSNTEGGSFSDREDLLALLDHLGVQKVSICGLSRGGNIALDFTLKFPDRVDALVLVAASSGGFEIASDQTGGLETHMALPAATRLGEVRVPTLVIAGDLDTSETRLMVDHLAEGIPGAKKVIFNGAARMVNLERPQEFNQLVLAFLGSIKRSKP